MKITRRQAIIATTIGMIGGLPTVTLSACIARPTEPELFRGLHNDRESNYGGHEPFEADRYSHHREKYMEKVRQAFRKVATGLYIPAYRDPSTRLNTGFAVLTFEQSYDGCPSGYHGNDYEFEVFCWQMEKVADHFRSLRLPVELVSLNFTRVIIDPMTFEPMIPYAMEWNE
jgi:hypothetical protein